MGGSFVAFRIPRHAWTDAGGFHRSGPTGGAANGIHLNTASLGRSPKRLPSTIPPSTRAVGGISVTGELCIIRKNRIGEATIPGRRKPFCGEVELIRHTGSNASLATAHARQI